MIPRALGRKGKVEYYKYRKNAKTGGERMRKGKPPAGSQVTYPQQESISRRNILRERKLLARKHSDYVYEINSNIGGQPDGLFI